MLASIRTEGCQQSASRAAVLQRRQRPLVCVFRDEPAREKLKTQPPNPQIEKRCLFHSWNGGQGKHKPRGAGGGEGRGATGAASVQTREGGNP